MKRKTHALQRSGGGGGEKERRDIALPCSCAVLLQHSAFLHCLSRLSSNPFSISILFAFLFLPFDSPFLTVLLRVAVRRQAEERSLRTKFIPPFHHLHLIYEISHLLPSFLSKSRQIRYFSSTVCLNAIDFSVLKWSDFQNFL